MRLGEEGSHSAADTSSPETGKAPGESLGWAYMTPFSVGDLAFMAFATLEWVVLG